MKINFNHAYDPAFSKNAQHGLTETGEMFNRTATQRLINGIAMLTRGECNRQGIRFNPIKTWIRIKVIRPDMRLDPINFLDTVADGIKVGLGIDDNLFAGSVDWELDPENPGIEIEVEQEDEKR